MCLCKRIGGWVGAVFVHEGADLGGVLIQAEGGDVEYDIGGIGGVELDRKFEVRVVVRCNGTGMTYPMLQIGEEGERHAASDGIIRHDQEGQPSLGDIVEEVLLPNIYQKEGQFSFVRRRPIPHPDVIRKP